MEARRTQRQRFPAHILQRTRANRAAHVGNDAIGAAVVASLLNLHYGAGMAFVRGYVQRLEGGVLQAFHRANRNAARNGVL